MTGAETARLRGPSIWWLCCWMIWLAGSVFATESVAPGNGPTARNGVLEVFVRDGCPHCAEAEAFLRKWRVEHPEIPVVFRPVDRDAASREALIALSRRAGVWPPGVPTFVHGDRVLVGFGDPARFEAQLQSLLEDPASVDPAGGEGTKPAAAPGIELGCLGTVTPADLGLPLFTLVVGLLDGFNPCAMWVLLFLLSLLLHLRDRRRMALIAGVFVLSSGAVYYAFMAAWLNLFLAVGFSDSLRIGLALLALLIALVNFRDFLRGPNGLSLSIPQSARLGIYPRVRGIVQARSVHLALVGAMGLAIVVNFVELLCTAGLPAMYTAILSQQGFEWAGYHAYLLLYIGGYLLDDAIMVALAVTALGSRRLGESAGDGSSC